MTAPQDIVERALSTSKADGCVAIVSESSDAHLRWANNTLTIPCPAQAQTTARDRRYTS